MDRDSRIRSEMKTIYEKMCTAALQLDTAEADTRRLEADLTAAHGRQAEAEAALARTLAGPSVSLRAFQAQRVAAAIVTSETAAIEGWLLAKRAEAARIRDTHVRLDEDYQRLNKELASPGGDVIEFQGRGHVSSK